VGTCRKSFSGRAGRSTTLASYSTANVRDRGLVDRLIFSTHYRLSSSSSGQNKSRHGQAPLTKFQNWVEKPQFHTLLAYWTKQLVMLLFHVVRKIQVGLIYRTGNLSLVSNYRPVSLTSVVSKQMAHVMASHLRVIWNKRIGYSKVNTDSSRDFHAIVK
jgi:hypothetical protein